MIYHLLILEYICADLKMIVVNYKDDDGIMKELGTYLDLILKLDRTWMENMTLDI